MVGVVDPVELSPLFGLYRCYWGVTGVVRLGDVLGYGANPRCGLLLCLVTS